MERSPVMRLLGTLLILLAFGSLALDFIAMQETGGGFALRSLDAQLTGVVGLTDDQLGPYREGFGGTILALPAVAVLGGLGIILMLLSSLLFGRKD